MMLSHCHKPAFLAPPCGALSHRNTVVRGRPTARDTPRRPLMTEPYRFTVSLDERMHSRRELANPLGLEI